MLKKTIAVGNSSFVLMRMRNCFYVDKTPYIKRLIESGSFVQLITRPRRFGKSLFLDTLRTYLAVNPANPEDVSRQKVLFENLAIAEDAEFCRTYMGRVPVFFLSMKGFTGPSFSYALGKICKKIAAAVNEYSYLLESPRLTDNEKGTLQDYFALNSSSLLADERRAWLTASSFLPDILYCLTKHFGRPAMLLIDEYDVPLEKAASSGYYAEMRNFIRDFLSVLKPEDAPLAGGFPVLEKAVLTGCLRVSKESIFTGVNKFSVNTVCSTNENLAASIGFIEDEVKKLLNYYGLADRSKDVKAWYDGYRFGSSEIYSPWDVLSFCQDALASNDAKTAEPDNYWINTSSNDAIDEFLGFLTEEDAGRMQTLLDGGSIELNINEQLTYSDFVQHKSEDFWTLLLFTGYLTVDKYLGGKNYLLRIPNEEIRQTFRSRVSARFSSQNAAFAAHGIKLAEAAVTGNASRMAEVLEPLLRTYVSVRDSATRAPAENYYHGFLSALFACAGSRIQDFRSNAESGNGYADIIFSSGSGPDRCGVVIEIKRAARQEDLPDAVDEALRQVDKKDYSEALRRIRCSKYFAYGIAFCGKTCEVGGGELKQIAR